MTMRADIVSNDAGELVRREHARDLGAGVVVAIYRLTKLAMMHDLGNQAFMRQLDQAHQLVTDYCLRAGASVNILFADRAVFVAGQLLKGSRGTYDAAAELGEIFDRFGGSELFIARDVTREDLLALSEQISTCHRTGGQFRLPTPRIRIRKVSDAARLRGIHLEDLGSDQRIVRAYATAVVIMRRFFEDLQAGKYVLPRRIKRIAQSLVDLSDAHTAAFLGVTEVRNANHDEAGRAANTAILAVSIARELTQDRTVLAQIAMAAMMHDVARPRALALAAAGGPALPGMQGPTTLSEDQEDRLASGAAAVLTALGRVNEPSITRTVVTFEALWLRRKAWLGPVYWGARAATLHASILAVARRYNDLLTPEPGMPPPTPDYAVAVLASELADPQDRAVLRMLVSALGLLPTGTVVQLATGEVAEVVRGARGLGEKPVVRLLADASNQPYAQAIDVDLAQDARRSVLRVLSVDGWQKGLADKPASDIAASYDPDAAAPPAGSAPPNPLPAIPPPASVRDSASSFESVEHPSSQSLSSMGSSPSHVAEAMGKMIAESFHPPEMPVTTGDRTLFQPGGPELARRSGAPALEATAKGNLAATPLPHVLVYMLDHDLTGSVVFEGAGNDDTIYFVAGVPAKVRLLEPTALLGRVLVDAGALDEATIEKAAAAARRVKTRLGEHLVAHGLVSREMLAWALEAQLLQKIAHLANLAPEVEYAYYRDRDLLDGWGAAVSVTHPLSPILASVRHWHDRARIRATLHRVGKHPLVLHGESDPSSMAMTREESAVFDAIRTESLPLAELFARKLADEETVSSLVYTLAVTRQLAFKGQTRGPMAARAAPSPGEYGTRRAASAVPQRRSGPVVPRGSAPQIRPIAGKKGTIQGLQPSAVGSMQPGSGSRHPIAAPAPRRVEDREDDDESAAKTIALVPSQSRIPVTAPVDAADPALAEAEAALEAMQSFRLAEAALARNDLAGAERLAERALAGDPMQPDYVALLAWVRALGGRPGALEHGVATLSNVLIEDPSNERALLYRGRLLLQMNRPYEALNDLDELLSTNPHHREAAAEARVLRQRLGAS